MRSYPGKKYLIVFNTWQKVFHYHFSTARLTIKNKLGILILPLKIFRQPIKANNVDNIERFTLEGTAFHNDLHMTQNALWGKVFKSGLNKFSARQPLKNLLSPFLNTLYNIQQQSLLIAKVKMRQSLAKNGKQLSQRMEVLGVLKQSLPHIKGSKYQQ